MSTQKKIKAGLGSPPPLTPSYSSANRKATLQPRPLWSALPPNALREIYLCSAFEDRMSMGAVCKSWQQGFRDPELWRSRCVEFGGTTSGKKLDHEFFARSERGLTFTSGQNATRFEDLFSTYLENLEILFKARYSRQYKEDLTNFMVFYSRLEKSRLRSLTLYNLDLSGLNRPKRTRFFISFMKLTSRQQFLKKFRMNFTNFDLDHFLQFLNCLAGACGDTLETLYLKGFFKDLSIYQLQQVVADLERFKRLSRMHVEYNIVSEELIKHVALGCPNLSFIKFWVKSHVLPCNFISCKAWQALVSTHPNVLVEINARLFGNMRRTLPILAADMPAYKLKWSVWSERQHEIDLKCLLHRVASYHRTIKVLYVHVPGEFPNLDNISVKNILADCRNLLPITCAQKGNPMNYASWTLAKI